MTNLRKEAQGRDCYVQLDGICNHDATTTVPHHLRHTGLTREADEFSVPACFMCHSAIHRQIHQDLDPDYLEFEELRAWRRWRVTLYKEGKR